MTTLLPAQDLAMLRAIAKTIGVLLVAVRIDQLHPGRATADWEIADILEVDKRTVIKQLRSLSAAGMVLAQGERYVVTLAGRNTLFGLAGEQIAGQPSLSIEEGKITDELAISARTQCVLHDDDDIKSDSDSESSSSLTERTKCARLLEATHLLFANGAVNSDGILHQNPEWVLAWIAKAYNDRRNLGNPQGLVYKRLKDGVRPPVQYLKNAAGFLPNEYLVEVGLMAAPVDEVVAEDEPEYVSNAEYDGAGRNRAWLDVVRDDACPIIKGVGFTGSEPVTVNGRVMTVTVRNPHGNVLQIIAEHNLEATMSRIYAAQRGLADAQIVFVAAETEGVA